MEEIKNNASVLLGFLLIGISAGLIYDLLRPFRRGKLSEFLLDLIFCVSGFSVLFIFTMSCRSAAIGIWEMAFALAGFVLYIHCLSGLLFPIFYKSMRAIVSVLEINKKYIRKNKLYRKNLFKKTQK